MAPINETVLWLFDMVLVLLMLGLSWRVMRCDNHFTAVVLFIAFGLVMALVWVRLAAPDVALAEVAIGAGVTGVLLVTTLARLEDSQQSRQGKEDHNDARR